MTLRQQFYAFWPQFLSTHLDRRNRLAHIVGNLWMLLCLILVLLTRHWIFLPLALCGYLPSWIGHFVFERNVPITFKGPLLSALCDLKMMGLIMAGELEKELMRLFGSSRPVPGAAVVLSAVEEIKYQEALRSRINVNISSHPFTEYWDIFVLKHQRPINFWIHALAIVYLYLLLVISLVTQNFFLLLFIPLSPMAGLISHALFERTHIDFEDAIFSPRAFYCLNKLTFCVLTGRYSKIVEQTHARLRAWQEKVAL